MIRKFSIFGFLVMGLGCVPASAEVLSMGHVLVERGVKDTVSVSAKGVSLGGILQEFSRVLALSIEQNGLSSELRTLNCAANEPRILLKCLVGGGVSFMIQAVPRQCSLAPSNWCGIRVKVWQDGIAKAGSDPFSRLHLIAPNIEKLLRSPDSDDRAKGIDEILANQAIDGPLAISLLKRLSRDRQSTVRASSIHGMGIFEDQESQSLILEATRDGSEEVRLLALDALAVSEQAREAFERALSDEDLEVRTLASHRLEQLYRMGRSEED